MRVVRLESYVIPTYGNRHAWPYGRMLVEHNKKQCSVRFGRVDRFGRSYITLNRRRYYFHNCGSLYSPQFVFDNEVNKDVSRDEKSKIAHLEELLNNLVDLMVDASGRNLPVIQKLSEHGFTEDDLVFTLGFPVEEVRQVLSGDDAVQGAQ